MEPQTQITSGPKSQASNIILVILVLAALVLGYFLYQNLYQRKAETGTPRANNSNTLDGTSVTPVTPVPPGQLANLPVLESHPAVESVALTEESYQYFFGGPIQEAVTLPQGTQITLENGNGLPPMILPTASNPFTATLVPGGTSQIQATTHAALRKGVYVQALMYYHIPDKSWLLKDIYIPSEKN